MQIRLCQFQKMGAITHPADRAVFAFSRACSPGGIHFFDCSLVPSMDQSSHILPTVTKPSKVSFEQRQTLLWSGLMVVVRTSTSEQTGQSSPDQNFMQGMTHAVRWDAYHLSYFAHLQWKVCLTMDFSDVTLGGSHFRGIWRWLIKSRCATTLKLVKPIF